MNQLEQYICSVYGYRFCNFTGNGTTAMYLLFLALNLQDKKVLYPAISCTNPVNASLYAGYKPTFCDINLDDYTLDLESLEEKLKLQSVGIVVPTHIYGHQYNRRKVRQICDKYGAFVLEDAAQTVNIGESDAAIISFGHSKILEASHGGGAVLCNDLSLYTEIKKHKKQIAMKEYKKHLFDEYRMLYYQAVQNSHSKEERCQLLFDLQKNSYQYFIFDMNSNDEVFFSLRNRERIINERKYKTKLYNDKLKSNLLQHPKLNCELTVAWRYTFLVKSFRDILLEKVREKNVDISSWYYSLTSIYNEDKLKNAELLEEHVVNLWVDITHSRDQIENELKIIHTILNKLECGNL